jgi:hypothetical protein
MVGDEGRSRKLRVTLERKITWRVTAEGDGGLIVGKAAGGGPRYLIRWDAWRCGKRRDFWASSCPCGSDRQILEGVEACSVMSAV